MDNDIKLLPCPFCGSQGRRFKTTSGFELQSHGVQCTGSECAVVGPQWDNKHDADHAWNNRQQLTKPADELITILTDENIMNIASAVLDKALLSNEDTRARLIQFARDSIEYALIAKAKPADEVSKNVLLAAQNDRDMLNFLMERFDNENWECEDCGNSEDCATMDSAIALRAYLKFKPADDTISVSKGEWEAMKKLLDNKGSSLSSTDTRGNDGTS
jgi:hypothetical protein